MSIDNNILVSICMLTYNHESFIREAIAGVQKQKTNFEFELIILDDCSTDKTSDICRNASEDKHIVYNRNERNIGLKENYYKFFSLAKGKYYAICEGDDYWSDELKLQKQVDFLELNPQYGLVHTQFDIFFNDIHEFKRRNNTREQSTEYSFKSLLTGDALYGSPTLFFRKESYERIKEDFKQIIDTLGGLTIDLPLILLISKSERIGFINEYTAVYRRGLKSLSGNEEYSKYINFSCYCRNVKLTIARNYYNKPDQKKIIRVINYWYEYGHYLTSILKQFEEVRLHRLRVRKCLPNNKKQLILFIISYIPILENLFLAYCNYHKAKYNSAPTI